MREKICIVTGGTSGIGLATVNALRARGNKVYVFSRKAIAEDSLSMSVDVTDENAVRNAVKIIHEKEGSIDTVINCAGYGISGAIEFTSANDVKNQFDVNFFGLDIVCRAVIPYMRKQKSGTIVNISSVAAPAAIPFQAYYSATKSAINTYSLALANELRPFGIKVTAIQPGDIKTGFTEARVKTVKGDDVYSGRINRSVSQMEHDEKNGMDPKIAGEFIESVAVKENPKPLYAIGFVYQAICVLLKILPARLANYIVYLIYAK